MSSHIPQHCFHCDLPVPRRGEPGLSVLGEMRRFCCPGCLEVCRTIVEAGLEDYYRHRVGTAARADPEVVPDVLKKLALYDHPDIQRSFVRGGGGWREASLILEDVRCAACLWLNEQHLRRLDGVLAVEMDYASERARVRWDPERVALSRILRAIADIGYIAYPYDPTHREKLLEDRKRRDAQRLIFAIAAGMPVMQFSLASYIMGAPGFDGGLPLWVIIGRWTVLLAAGAILLYSGMDFFVGAWRDMRNRRLGMDIPIVIGLLTAFFGSLVATVRQQGEVYVDSIAMFVIFVLMARIFEIRGRVTAANAMDRLARVIPLTTRRLGPEGEEEEVPAIELGPGDRLQILPGEFLPADGVVVEGRSTFDESLLTGEATPVEKGVGQAVIAGTCNVEQPVTVEVTRIGVESTAGEVRQLLDRGLRSRPRYAMLAERAAEWFVALVLAIALATAAVWVWYDPADALANTIAVLIVTCPCALALATPVAVAVAAGRFAELGVVPLRMTGLEALAAADLAAFDKTGTLTFGTLKVTEVHPFGELNRAGAERIAAALGQASEHPVGRALAGLASGGRSKVNDRQNVPGAGVLGTVDGKRWRLGKPDFALAGVKRDREVWELMRGLQDQGVTVVALADGRSLAALFALQDTPRPRGEALIAALRAGGVARTAILSGDAAPSAGRLARDLGIDEAHGDLGPAEKLDWIKARQRDGRRIMMVGDGINDAPTLAAADVSVSFAGATDLAKLNSDFIVLAPGLEALAAARRLARRTRWIILQNLFWAGAYNLLAVPAAAMGYVPPWAAAIGMSVSSLIVVANALRLRRIAKAEKLPAEDGIPAQSSFPLPSP